MTIETLNNSPTVDMYDALVHQKGVDQMSQSLTFKVYNTRGFNARTNPRVVTRIDGQDIQAPGLNFPTNSLNGTPQLDIASVELIPGASSALYGPNAMNGLVNVYSKNPFDYQGVSASFRASANHFGDGQQVGQVNYTNPYDNPQMIYEGEFRFAKAFNNRFAFKITGQFLQGTDWAATDYNAEALYDPGLYNGTINATDPRFFGPDGSPYGPLNPGYDGVNLYGDEIKQVISSAFTQENFSLNFPDGPTLIARDGYRDPDVINDQARTANGEIALHYRVTDDIELIASSRVGTGNAVYMGGNRFQIQYFLLHTHRVEARGKNWFVRSYAALEDAGNTYDTRLLGVNMNRAWKDDSQWFAQYLFAYGLDFQGVLNTNSLINDYLRAAGRDTIAVGDHMAARAFANSDNNFLYDDVVGFLESAGPLIGVDSAGVPGFSNALTGGEAQVLAGTPEFERIADSLKQIPMSEGGALFVDQSWFQHNEAQYDFSPHLNGLFDLVVGGSFRTFFPRSQGVIFADVPDQSKLNIWEAGGYAQVQKRIIDERLTLQASIRADKSKKTDLLWSPRAAFTLALGPRRKHYIRGSWQRALRMPILQAYYNTFNAGIYIDTGSDPIVNNLFSLVNEDGSANVYTLESVRAFQQTGDASVLVQPNELNIITPERLQTFEVGYRAQLFKRVNFDANYYYNTYSNFSGLRSYVGPDTSNLGVDGNAALTVEDIQNEDFEIYRRYVNVEQDVQSHGASAGFEILLTRDLRLNTNYNYNALLGDFDAREIPFNTPEHKVNVGLNATRFGKDQGSFLYNLGAGANFRWVSSYFATPEQFGVFIEIPSFNTLDAQVTYRVPKIKTSFKLGGTNILNNYYREMRIAPFIGALYYFQITFDELLN